MKNIKSILVAVFSLSFATPACDVEDRGDALDEDELREEALEDPEAQPGEPSTPIALSDRGEPVGFDEERQMYLYDADGDSWPDVTEQKGGTDLLDPSSQPGPDPDANFPAISCRPGYIQAGNRLCINQFTQNATNYTNASSNCRNQLGRVCSYEDLSYLYLNTAMDATYNPIPTSWIGNIVADDWVLCGNASITSNNDPDIWSFENDCLKTDLRPYWCCHDDDA